MGQLQLSKTKSAASYADSEKKRRSDDPPRPNDKRSEFERDRSRIIHSAAFRRLQAKTQVFGLGGSDFFRTRLTHSLEVTQIGKGIALNTGETDPDLVEAICLAHDIGHPPFGHAGEEELHRLMRKFGGFEANAQNLRVVSRLEKKSTAYDGLNLTKATIDGILKYKKSYRQVRHVRYPKFYYDEDRKLVKWASGRHKKPSFECQIMDWADDIAYSVHDLEDGIKAGMISRSTFDDQAFKLRVRRRIVGSKQRRAFGKDWDFLAGKIIKALNPVPNESDRKAQRKSLVADLINYFIEGTKATQIRNAGVTRYRHALYIPGQKYTQCHLLKAIVWEAIIANERIVTLERKAKKIIQALFRELTQWGEQDAEQIYPQDFRERFRKGMSNKERARVACDYIAGMTDTYAIRLYSRLMEPEFSSLFEIL